MTYQRFEDLPVWQKAAELYESTEELLACDDFNATRGFRDQLDRAALSVSNNIAEGFERGTTNELLQFLYIARGSAGEVRSMLILKMRRAQALSWPDTTIHQLNCIRATAESCSRQLQGWAESLQGSHIEGQRRHTGQAREQERIANTARKYRLNWLRSLTPLHPLYGSDEAREARGEKAPG